MADELGQGQLVRVWCPLIVRVYADDETMAVDFAIDEMVKNSLSGESVYNLIDEAIDTTSFYRDTTVDPKFEVIPE
jgi:hypothetical protein